MKRLVITSVEEQKKNKNRVSIFINGEFRFGIGRADAAFLGLDEGKEVSAEKLKKIEETLVFGEAKDAAVRFISYRRRTCGEVKKKLAEKGFAKDVIEEVEEELKKYGLINDEEYCGAYIRDSMALNPKGKYLLRAELSAKGISSCDIEAALEKNILDEYGAAIGLLEKKAKHLDFKDPKERNKAEAFLNRRGYSYDVIKKAFENFE